jgi:hypothetical protein
LKAKGFQHSPQCIDGALIALKQVAFGLAGFGKANLQPLKLDDQTSDATDQRLLGFTTR